MDKLKELANQFRVHTQEDLARVFDAIDKMEKGLFDEAEALLEDTLVAEVQRQIKEARDG